MPRRKPTPSALRSARVAAYCRVSTEDQGERQTIQSQLDFLRKYVDLHQIDAFDFYVDDGVSGTIPLGERPDGARMLADARAGRFGAVLVYRLDRLGRNLRALLDSHDELDQAGVSIRSATEPFDTATPIGQFLFQLLGSLAELERTTIIERTTLGRDRVARDGKWTTGWLPAGYDLDASGRLIPSERLLPDGSTEADMIRDVFRRIADGATLVSEARRLEALGVPCIKRRPPAPDNVRTRWWPTTIHKIIRHPVYRGVYTMASRNGPVEIPVPALVSSDLWAAAGAAMTRNRDLSTTDGTRTYALRGLLRCRTVLDDGTICGRTYSGGPGGEPGADGARTTYYRCSGMLSHHNTPDRAKCYGRAITVSMLDDAIWADVRAFVLDPSAVFADAQAQLAAQENGQPDLAQEQEKLRRVIAAHQDERERAMLLFRKRLASIEETERVLAVLDAAISRATMLLASIDQRRSSTDTASRHLDDTARLLAGLHEYVVRGDAGDLAARRRVMEMLVREVSLSTEREARPRGRTRKHVRIRIRYVFSPQDIGQSVAVSPESGLRGYWPTGDDQVSIDREITWER